MTKSVQAEPGRPKPFADRATEAFINILRTAAVLDHQISEVVRPFGIRLTQYHVLRILSDAGRAGMCGREVAERMIARVPDVPRLLKRLEAMRFISRERDATDRRHVTARLTPKGRRLVESVRPRLEAVLRSRLSRLSDRTAATLVEGLTAVRNGS